MIEIPKKEPLNIVPFIDIMLVLLAMVLSISTFIAKGEIKIALPPSEAGAKITANDNPFRGRGKDNGKRQSPTGAG